MMNYRLSGSYYLIILTLSLFILPMPGFAMEPLQTGEYQSADQLKVPGRALENTHWKLIELNGMPLSLENKQREPYIILQPKRHSINGFAGCNRMMGSYTATAQTITFSRVGSTRMACQDGMDIEYNFLQSLESVKYYKKEENQLFFLDEARHVLARFIARDITSNTPGEAKTFVYICTDNYQFVTRIENGKARLFLPEKTINLSKATHTNDVKYSDGKNTYQIKGEKALLIHDGIRHEACLNNRKAAIWEHAKLDGVDFRAVGNEPPWVLQITAGGEITLQTGYAGNTYRFSTPEPTIDKKQNRSVYYARNGSLSIEVILSGKQCRDTMVDESYETSVTVWLNKKEYTGCGRALH